MKRLAIVRDTVSGSTGEMAEILRAELAESFARAAGLVDQPVIAHRLVEARHVVEGGSQASGAAGDGHAQVISVRPGS